MAKVTPESLPLPPDFCAKTAEELHQEFNRQTRVEVGPGGGDTTGFLRYDEPQTLTEDEQAQAQENIGVEAAKFSEQFNVRDYGAVGDGVINDHAAMQAASDDAFAAKGILVIPAGHYRCDSTLYVRCRMESSGDAYLESAQKIIQLFLGEFDMVTATPVATRYREFKLPNIIYTGTRDHSVANHIAVCLGRMYYCNIYFGYTIDHTIGIQLDGGGSTVNGSTGVAWCNFFLSQHIRHKKALALDSGPNGWNNQNTFYGGELNSAAVTFGERAAGYTALHLYNSQKGVYKTNNNNNVFINLSIEGGAWEYDIDFYGASANRFINTRFETGTTQPGRVRFYGENLEYQRTLDNQIDVGFAFPDPIVVQEYYVPTNLPSVDRVWDNIVSHAGLRSHRITRGHDLVLLSVADVTALTASTPLVDRQTIQTVGYSNAFDNGGNVFTYVAADLTTPANGGSVLVDQAGRRFKQVAQTTFNVKQWGAKGDGVTNDSPAFQAAIDAASPVAGEVVVPSGTYSIHTQILHVGTTSRRITIKGINETGRPILKVGGTPATGTPSVLRVGPMGAVRIFDLIIDGDKANKTFTDGSYPLSLSQVARIELNNVTVRNFRQTGTTKGLVAINLVETSEFCEIKNCTAENLISKGWCYGVFLSGNASQQLACQYIVNGCRFTNIKCVVNAVIGDSIGVVRGIFVSESVYLCEISSCWFDDLNNVAADEVTFDWEDADAIGCFATTANRQTVDVHDCYFRNVGKRAFKFQNTGTGNANSFATFRNNIVESGFIGNSPVPATSAINAMSCVMGPYAGHCIMSDNLIIGGRISAVADPGANLLSFTARGNVVMNEAYEGNTNGSIAFGFYGGTSGSLPARVSYENNYIRMKGRTFYVYGDTRIVNNTVDNSWNTNSYIIAVNGGAVPETTYVVGNNIKTWNGISTGLAMTCVVFTNNRFVQSNAGLVTSLTGTGTTATATVAAHGFSNGDSIQIAGAHQTEYNKINAVISNVTTDTFDYTITTPTASPATGYILASKLKPLGIYIPAGSGRDYVISNNIFEGFYGPIYLDNKTADTFNVTCVGNVCRATFGNFPVFASMANRTQMSMDDNAPYGPSVTNPNSACWHHTTGTTVGAAGAAAALPTAPAGYITVVLNGTLQKIPYYTA